MLLGIGECMVELRDSGARELRLGFGGDVLNTLVYAGRQGVPTAFATVTGDDHYGRWLRTCWEDEGINCDLVRHDEGTAPALYVIRNEPSGERHFHYWRDASPFRALFRDATYVEQLAGALGRAPWVYVSGIALALLDDADRTVLLTLLAGVRQRGGEVAFDPNYRARLWPDRGTARHWLDRAYGCATVALPSREDERTLRSDEIDAPALAGELFARGCREVIAKDGVQGAFVRSSADEGWVTAHAVSAVVDTTAAGDAFNGAWLAARMRGAPALEAARAGARLAASIVQHPGAITPRAVR